MLPPLRAFQAVATPYSTIIGPCRGSIGPGLRRGGEWMSGEGLFHSLSVEPQLGDVARVLLELAALDALDDVDEALVGAGLDADLLAFAHDKAVQIFDLGAPAFGHILTNRRPLIGRAAADPRQPPSS
jgi:hypothetical protein